MKLLVVASAFRFQYRVLRCAAATGAAVFILGDRRAAALARSRYCAGFIESAADITADNASTVAAQVNDIIARHAIDRVLPSDGRTTHLLATIGGQLTAPLFPIPPPDVFGLLDDKARFMALCAELALPHPPTQLFQTRADLAAAWRAGELRFPSIAKPINLYGKIGVERLDADTIGRFIQRVGYAPILVQDFIDGQDICISLFCEAGVARAEVVYLRRRGTFYYVCHPVLSASARRIAAHLRYDGVIEFDARLSPDGVSVQLIECNPRFWYNMDIAMIAGINFVALGCGNQAAAGELRVEGAVVRLPKAILATLLTPWRYTRRDAAMLRYALADPVPFAMMSSGLAPD